MKRLFNGLGVLLKYDPDGDTCAEHDLIYCGGVSPDKMTEEDLKILEDSGFFYDEDDAGWNKFT